MFTMDDLLAFIEKEDERLIKDLGYFDREKRILVRTIKVSEEVGELSDEVASFLEVQRKDKVENFNMKNLEGELADVIFVTMLLAESIGVDIVKALKDKADEVDKYYENNIGNV